ncbi:MAG: hypothetical protein WCO52_00740 [bacterium]
MKWTRSTKDKLTVGIGGAFLLVLVISAWVPQPCSYLRNHVFGCPKTTNHFSGPTTENEKQLAGVPHQDVTTGLAYFTSGSQEYRKETLVNFQYRGDGSEVAYLEVKLPNGYHDLALVSHPLLKDLNWTDTITGQYQFFQRNPEFQDLKSALASHPSASTLAADTIIARDLGLKDGSYVPLESLTSLNGVSLLITSSPRQRIENGWHSFSKQFDLSNVQPSAKGQIEWMIKLPNHSNDSGIFHLGTVHIDYQKIKP